MRTASLDQSSPTADPKITVTVGGQTYNTEGTGVDATQRVMRVLTDEQAWGSAYIVILDNSDETLNGLSLEGLAVTLNMAFIGETADNFPPLRVLFQEHTSEEGKLLLKLTVVDDWTFIETTEVTYTGAQFNQHWQTTDELDARYMPDEVTLVKDVPALYDELLANGDRTVWQIIQYLAAAAGVDVAAGDTDAYINTLKPPLNISNVRSGIRQALDTTACYLKLHTDGVFRPHNPSLHSTVYSFNTLDLFYTNAHEAAVTIPNRIHVWAYSETGSAWLDGTADDSDSQTALSRVVPRHYYIATLDSKVTRTQAELDTMAEGILAKIQHEGAQGEIVAPMHVSLELFDKVAVIDSRYSPSRTIEGYVHRIQREYDRGVYRIKIFLGGVTGGYTAPGGQDPGGLVDAPAFKPPTPDWEAPPWDEILPKAVQGYTHDITFSSTSASNITWTSGTIKFYDGTTQAILSGSGVLPSGTPHPIQYIIFDLNHASPNVLQMVAASDYLTTYFSEHTSVLCVAQRAATGDRAIFLPGWEKQPLIVTDMIHMAGLRNWTDPVTGHRYQQIADTQITAGQIKISGETYFSPNYDPTHKGKTFHTTPTTPYNLGDIWIDDKVYKYCTTARQTGSYNAGDWSTSTKKRIGSTYLSDGKLYLSSVIQTTDAQYVTAGDKTTWTGRTQVYRQTTAPTSGMKIGDIWFDTGNGDKPYTWTGAIWIPSYTIIDGGYIKTGLIDANRIQLSATTTYAPGYDPSGKSKTFYTTPATPYNLGDVWIDNEVFKYCTTARQTGTFQSGDWTVSDKKRIGSTYISAGKLYLSSVIQDSSYRTSSDTEKVSWNGKNRVFRQSNTPSARAVGDLWYNSGDNDKCYRATATGTGNWVRQYTEIDGGHIKTGTIDASQVTISAPGHAKVTSTGLEIAGQSLWFVESGQTTIRGRLHVFDTGGIRALRLISYGSGTHLALSSAGTLYLYGLNMELEANTIKIHSGSGVDMSESGYMDVPIRSSPPSGTQAGRVWFDTTKNLLCYYRPGVGNRFIQDGAY